MTTAPPVDVVRTTPRRSLRRRRLIGLLGLLIGLVVACLLSVAVGANPIPLGTVWQALVAFDGSQEHIVVQSLRVPRTLLGIAAGAALGLAGALIQGHTRNPLADPGLLGVNNGAAFLVVVGIYVFGITSPVGYVWFAFAGAALAAIVVFVVGSAAGKGGASPVTLALAGAAVSALLSGLTQAIILTDVATLDAYRFWSVGSIAGRDGELLNGVIWFLVVGALIGLAGAPALNALSLGDDVARSLGHNVFRTRAIGIVAITLLAGGATALCGPMWFIGLVVPHVVRSFTGPDHRWLMPASALTGGVLLLLADIVGRVVARPGELQVGIVLALIGGPFFVALVRRRKLAAI